MPHPFMRMGRQMNTAAKSGKTLEQRCKLDVASSLEEVKDHYMSTI